MEDQDKILELIKVTEERTLAEERVRMMLTEITTGQDGVRSEVGHLANQLVMLSRCIEGLQQMITIVVEYMAVIAGRDHDEIREIRERLLASLAGKGDGISFGEHAKVGIGGDVVGGDQKGTK